MESQGGVVGVEIEVKEFEKYLLDCVKICSSFIVVASVASSLLNVLKLCVVRTWPLLIIFIIEIPR